MNQVQTGQAVDLRQAEVVVRDVLGSLFRKEEAFASLLRLKSVDTYTFTHSVNCCVLLAMLARRCGFDRDLVTIGLEGLLHDIGKVKIPEEVLKKRGPLTESEWALVREHPRMGADIVEQSQPMQSFLQSVGAILQHHERLDGSGYPGKLKGDNVSLVGRMMAIVDVYDAMTSDRGYCGALPSHEAIRVLCEQAGQQFDPELVNIFSRAVGLFPMGSLVRLETGDVGIVTKVNALAPLHPTIFITFDTDKKPLDNPYLLHLAEPSHPHAGIEIIAVEDPALFGIDIETYLAMLSQDRVSDEKTDSVSATIESPLIHVDILA